MVEVTLLFAFVAGLVSFASPCILPLVPGFLAYLAGSSLDNVSRKKIFLNSVFFVLGFAAVFSLVGVLLNTLLESIAYDAQVWLARIGGAIIIFFGLYLVGLIKIPFLEREHKFAVKTKLGSRHGTSFLFGAAFAAGWTPCVGAVLGSILGLAASQPGSALTLLFTYSIGLGVPFLLVGLFASRASQWIQKNAFWLQKVSVAFGVLLIILGILVFTQQINRIASFDLLNQLLLNQ